MKWRRAGWRNVWLVGLTALWASGALPAEKVAAMPAPTGYVDDYAGVMSGPAKEELEGLCSDLHRQTRAQVFFVTVKTLDGEAVETFANELFAKWKVGEKKTDRGVLLLLATNDHKRWIEVGYGFEGILNDAKVGDIGREMVPALRASNYDEAARIGVRDVSRVIAADAGVTVAGLGAAEDAAAGDADATPPPAPEGIGKSSAAAPPVWAMILLPVIFVSVFGLIVWGVLRNRGKGTDAGGGSGSGGGWTSGGGWSSGDGGGGSSGGGDSFSGGDGGSSGGGGAGGSW